MKKSYQNLQVIGRFLRLSGITAFLMAACAFNSYANDAISVNGETTYLEDEQPRRKVTGTVLDESGEPVIGATIIVKGTTSGAITDANGKFQLDVAPDAVLEISHVAYTGTEVAVGGKTNIDVVLQEDSELLDEVIVIGYGTTTKKDFTGSVTQVKMEDSPIAFASTTSAYESLKGNVAGLSVGASATAGATPSLEIRGDNSLSGGTTPLIVVDGVIFLGGINEINPSDIATFDVLKDATSAAAYGSRSANGVILITTKKGKVGKPVITLNTSLTLESWWQIPEVYSGEGFIESVQQRSGSTDMSWMVDQCMANYNAGIETDWMDYTTRLGVSQDHQLAVSGATEKTNYYMSINYTDKEGVVIGDDYNRISTMFKISTHVTDWMTVSLDASYAAQDYSGVAGNPRYAQILNPYGCATYDGVNMERYPNTQSVPNPLWNNNTNVRENKDVRNNFRTKASIKIEAPWVEGLSYTYNFQGALAFSESGNFYYPDYYINEGSITETDRYSASTIAGKLANANGTLTDSETSSWVMDHILNYNKTWGKHRLDLTGVFTADKYQTKSNQMYAIDFTENGNTSLGLTGLDYGTTQIISLSGSEKSNMGMLARASYSYDDRFFASGSFRRDGASVFGVDNKWGNFGAVGVAWNMTNEAFMQGTKDFLSNLKVKASWGRTGNQSLSAYSTLSTMNVGYSGGMYYTFDTSSISYGLSQSSLGNTTLGWETTEAYNFGIETSWFNNRLSVDIDAYKSNTFDQIFSRTIPSMTGFTSMYASMGEVGNNGVDVSINSTNIQTQDFRWGTGLTFSLNRNKIIHLYGEDLDGDGIEDDDTGNGLFIGESITARYGYTVIGTVQESDLEYMEANSVTAGTPKYKDINEDGVIDTNDRSVVGCGDANFSIGLSNTFTYKNWDLYVMVNGIFGGNGYYTSANTSAYYTTTTNYNTAVIDYWTPENQSNDALIATFSGDSKFSGYQDRTFIRLQDIVLSYTFRGSWLEKANMSALKVFVSGKNLGTLTGWDGVDPETSKGMLLSDNTYPTTSSITFGANIRF